MKKLIPFLLIAGLTYTAKAQEIKIDSSKYPRIVTFTAQQDHDNMKQQLGIKN